jgi:putative phosphoribosyl transferase
VTRTGEQVARNPWQCGARGVTDRTAAQPKWLLYRDRHCAGLVLAEQLLRRLNGEPAVVVAIANGGVAVALPIAEALETAIRVCLVEKIRVPEARDYGVGAVSLDGDVVRDDDLLGFFGIDAARFERRTASAKATLVKARRTLGGGPGLGDLRDRCVVVVDDGVASGMTAEAAVGSVQRARARDVLVATPVIMTGAIARLRAARIPHLSGAEVRSGECRVDDCYADFSAVPVTAVRDLVARSRQQLALPPEALAGRAPHRDDTDRSRRKAYRR